jgi:ABC-type Fe3+ transport system permease subunit
LVDRAVPQLADPEAGAVDRDVRPILPMTRQMICSFLIGLSLGVALAWFLEAFLVGRGVVSTYLAPIAFVVPIVVAIYSWRSKGR